MFAICWIAYIQWETTIASFTQELNISMSQYSILWTVNGIMILVAQPLIRPAIILLKGNLKYQMLVGILIFMLSFFVTSFAEQFTVFLIGMIILTFGEMFVWPAVPTIANYLAPEGKQGQYQGVVNSASTVGKAFGPLIGGVLVDTFNMSAMFIGIMFLLIVGIIFLSIFDKDCLKEINRDNQDRILFIHEFKQNSNYHLQLVLESHNIKMYWSSNLSTFHQRASGGEN